MARSLRHLESLGFITPGREVVRRDQRVVMAGECIAVEEPAAVASPGAIVRTWTASIGGTIRVYLDGAEEPIFDGPAVEFLHEPYRRFAEKAGIDVEVFEGTYRQRDACYFPIPFAKRCRTEWTGNIRNIHFYEIQIRRYTEDAEVVTFEPADLKTYRSQLTRVARVLDVT